MLEGAAKEGRFPSDASWPRTVGTKFRSTVDCWWMFRENVTSAVKRKSLLTNGPRSPRLPRQLVCDANFGSISTTFGWLLTNDGFVPAAHVVGIDDGSCMYA